MSGVRIVTDSTADLPADIRKELGIEMVPLKVLFGSEAFADGVDLGPDEFYAKLAAAGSLPTTSQPSPAEFLEVYERLAKEGDGPILSIHLASVLSGTYQSAMLASTMVEGGADVTVVDSRSASWGIGNMVIAAAEAAREGRSKEEILEIVRKLQEETKIYFLVDTLEYLQKGGRIGRAAALVGSLLNIKPILSLNPGGEVYSLDKVRGQKKAMNRIVELIREDFGDRPIRLIPGYTSNKETAAELQSLIAQNFDVTEVRYGPIGPVIGTHVGPGTVAAFVFPR
ncbi:DegV family protein [Paenibacillus mucilaginosus]|uniref:DegV family protein n=1 Tax=Paenibacillus mucilaginosus TaxID=61624 RepID=UPI0002EB0844|nr:DegV family protein [Paenibacillus mucilaginosus]MCG7213794.1 DegV family protein [Paenibacillus mucilaginosus]WDM25806.1 DegV family protein [Paenibacillus mucilaginosus]